MILATLPIQAVDFIGSVIMIVLSLLCLRLVRGLNTKDPNNLIWTYLLWVCYGLAVFSVSRSIGHILKQILLISGHKDLWNNVRPLSGAINTFMLTVVAAVTLFFERIWKIYRQILEDKQTLQKTHNELLYLNQNLERLVSERTEALARSEKKMAQADKLASIGQLSAGIAHEINNPLGIILGYTQLLLRCEPPDTQKHEDLKTIEKHVKNCKSIVEDLLNFARSSKTKKEIVNIHDLLDKVLNFICHNSKFDKVRLEKNYEDNIPLMLLDEKKIEQVMMNLIMNARHAVAQKGTIRISTKMDAEAKQVSIRVEDTGYGIEQKNLSKIFDPFFTTKPTGEGTGLGLSVSYGIIKDHGGDIWVESEPDQGASFTVILPLVAYGEEES